MEASYRSKVIALLALLLLLGVRPAFAASVAPAVLDRIANGESVSVIVELSVAVQREKGLSQAEIASQRQNIANAQAQVREQLRSVGSPPDKAFQTTPAMALRANAAILQRLQNMPLVQKVVEDKRTVISLNESNPIIEANQMWSASPPITGDGYAVAVLDTGVDKNHTFFNDANGSAVVSEYCASSTFYDGDVEIVSSLCPGGAATSTASGSGLNCASNVPGCDHGTHVAGIVAGRPTELSIGTVRGVAPEADIIAMQVFSQGNVEFYGGGAYQLCGAGNAPCVFSQSSDQMLALERVLLLDESQGGPLKVAAANMSLGGGQYFDFCDSDNSSYVSVINNLLDAGIAVAIATGNDGWGDSIAFPSCLSPAISVASTTKSDRISGFSNMASGLVDVAAPGSSIASAVLNNGWAYKSGTSMATPHVAGAWALMRQALDGATPASVASILGAFDDTATNVTLRENGFNTGFGVQRINIAQAAALPPSGSAPDAPTLSLASVTDSSATLTITANGQGSSPIETFTTSCEIPEAARQSFAGGGASQATGPYDRIVNGAARGDGYVVANGQGNLQAFATLDEAKAISQIRVSVPGGEERLYNLTEATLGHQGASVWVGRNASVAGESLVLSSDGKNIYGIFVIDAQRYEIQGPASNVLITMLASELFPEPIETDAIVPNASTLEDTSDWVYDIPITNESTVIDLVMLYTPAAAAGTSDINLYIDTAMAVANQALENSGVTHRYNLLHAAQTQYTESSDMSTDLSRLANASDGYMDEAWPLADAYGSDLVHLFTAPSNYCGIAYRPTTFPNVGAGFGVTSVACASQNLSFPHELGHNLGANHDPLNSSGTPYPNYSYGWQDTAGVFRTVMAYYNGCPSGGSCTRIDYFSNTTLAYSGRPMGSSTQNVAAAFNVTAPAVATNRTRVEVSYTVTPSSSGGGTISPSTPQQVQSGSTTSFTITANSGYEISSVTGCSGSLSGSTYTTGAITQNCTVVANFSPVSSGYSVTYTITGMGSVSPGSPQTVSAGGTASFTLTPSSNYAIGSVGGTCPSGSVSGSIYTTGAINADCSIAFSFDQFKWEQTSANTSVTFNGLPSDTAFQCVSVATNAVGDSGPSAPVNFNTTGSSGSTPLPPTITSVTPGNGSLTVAFTPNASGPQADSYTATCVPSQADITAADVAMASQVQDKSDWHRSDAFKSGGHRCGADEVQARYQQLQPLASPAASTADCSLYNTSISSEYNPLSSGAYVIPVYWHVITTSGGGGNVTDANINAQMAVLNEDFAAIFDTTIQFELVGITRTANDGWFSDSPSDESAYKSALGIDPSRYLNIYTNDASGYLGYATFPADTAGTTLDGVVMNWAYVGGRNLPGASPYDLGRTLVHEVGHYLGLWHTFQGNGGTCANTFTSGDYIIDTWPHDTPDFGTSGSSVCGGITDIENFMNYSDDVAMIEFSSQQSNRMICSLINYRPQLYSIDTPGFTATGSGSPLTVTGLSNGTEYSCSVTASSASGDESAPSSAVLGTPAAQTVPQSPAITGSEAGDGEIMLFVTADDGGLPILEYEASCTDGVNTFTGSSTSSPVTVSGLENDTAYQCTVRARNALGWSGDSALTSPITPEGSFKGLPVWMIYEAIQ